MDKCKCEFDSGCEVLDNNNPLQINIFANQRGMGSYNSQEFSNNVYYSICKEHHSLGISIEK